MTAELAVALPAVALSAAAVVAVGQAAVAQLDCVDAARAGARAAARGDSRQRVLQVARDAGGGKSTVQVTASGPEVAVTVRRRVRLVVPGGPVLAVAARASTDSEPGAVSERGSATVLATAVVSASAVLAVVLALLGSAVVARHRAASAADLAALAAAGALDRPLSRACELAETVARRNGARLTGCAVDARTGSVDVLVSVRPGGPVGRLGDAASKRQGWR